MRALAVLCAIAATLAVPAHAAEFTPTRPLEIVVHGGPGSGNDLLARAVAAMIAALLLAVVQPVLVAITV